VRVKLVSCLGVVRSAVDDVLYMAISMLVVVLVALVTDDATCAT